MHNQPHTNPHYSNMLLSPLDLKKLTQNLSKKEILDQQVEKILLQMAEDFVVNVSDFACKLTKHRGADTLEKSDVKFAIEKLYNI
jgi:transcription initiation factor TFIID subunit 12